MIRCSVFFLATALAAGVGGIAQAADQPMDISLAEAVVTPAATGWYLRGDIGYAAWTGDEEPGYRLYGADGGAIGIRDFDDARFSHPVSYGVGVGYQFTDVIRADVTADIFKDRFNGNSDFGGACTSGAAATACGARLSADYRGIGILANGYVDLATIAGFTPYVGAGAGATQLKWGTLHSTSVCGDGEVSCAGGTGEYGGYDSWRFTYALMAGVSYDISERVKFDLGYRYSDIAGGDMFRFGATENAVASGAKGRDDGLSRHEFRAGLRISLW